MKVKGDLPLHKIFNIALLEYFIDVLKCVTRLRLPRSCLVAFVREDWSEGTRGAREGRQSKDCCRDAAGGGGEIRRGCMARH